MLSSNIDFDNLPKIFTEKRDFDAMISSCGRLLKSIDLAKGLLLFRPLSILVHSI